MPKPDLTPYLGQTVTARIDRPLGSAHPRFADMVYPVNYGFLPGTKSGDGFEIDAYVLGLDAPVTGEITARVIAVIERKNDNEDKLVVAWDTKARTKSEIADAVAFCERYFDTVIYVFVGVFVLPYKLAAVDLDDTLLGPDKQIGTANARAVARLREAGIHVTLASGRRHENMLQFHEQLKLAGPIVSCNGALTKNAESGEIYWEKRVPADLAQEIVTEGDRLNITQNYYHDNGGLFVREKNGWTELYQSRTGSLVTVAGDLHNFDGTSPLKILWIDAPETIFDLYTTLANRYANELYVTITDPEYVEFMAIGVNKAVGIQAVARNMGIEQSEVITFGDGNNDVPMLEWAGLGIAMSHARPAAQKAARWVASPGDPETSFARAVDQLLGAA